LTPGAGVHVAYSGDNGKAAALLDAYVR